MIDLDNGSTKYRLTGVRTGNGNRMDIIDRTVPFANKIRGSGSRLINDIVYWSFTSSFWKFAVASIFSFFALCVIFALLVLACVARAPDCLSPSLEGLPFTEQMNDAIHLSWTTFTTVGYGLIAPATGGHEPFLNDADFFDEEGRCLLVNFLLSFESLIGVLFVGFCSAILFGKITSFQSNARVTFSDVMVISFGMKEFIEDDESVDGSVGEDENQVPQAPKMERIVCPTIRFRIVNQLHSNRSGEIIDASLNTVATVDAKNSILGVRSEKHFHNAMQKTVTSENDNIRQTMKSVVNVVKKGVDASTTVMKKGAEVTTQSVMIASHGVKNVVQKSATKTKKQAGKVMNTLTRSHQLKGMPPLTVESARLSDSFDLNSSRSDGEMEMLSGMDANIVIQEETNVDQPNLVFSKVNVDPDSHPFFKSTWLVTHKLDVSSPFLTRSARKKVCANGGYWPEGLNNVEGIKKSIDFDQFLVSFMGTNKISGSNVYAQMIYTKDNVKYGYEFKSILMQNPDNSILVRDSDINFVQKQKYEQTKIDSAPVTQDSLVVEGTTNGDAVASTSTKTVEFLTNIQEELEA